jgi:hypothetical protein
MKYYDKLIFDLSKAGRQGYSLPARSWDATLADLPAGLRREQDPSLPEVSELDVVRHYTNLSQMNFGVDSGFYPLGSCTMKYNPKINEEIAAMPAFAGLHPLQPAETVQGALRAETYSAFRVYEDNQWHTVVIDLSTRIKDVANYFKPDGDGAYYLRYLQFRPFSGAQDRTAKDDYMDISYIAYCDSMDDIKNLCDDMFAAHGDWIPEYR